MLFVTIEMRHAPFFGWIHDLSAPDPTHIFNLFGLLPYDPSMVPMIGHFLAIGIWPVIMGITMFVQMKLNPTPPDPTQAMLFTWMPVLFTFMLASFPAGLVIYWAWNNTLSVTQQYIIMRRSGTEVNLFGNILETFGLKKKPAHAAAAGQARAGDAEGSQRFDEAAGGRHQAGEIDCEVAPRRGQSQGEGQGQARRRQELRRTGSHARAARFAAARTRRKRPGASRPGGCSSRGRGSSSPARPRPPTCRPATRSRSPSPGAPMSASRR